ncbi:MAG: hypothetical protein IKS28_04280 [Clostridia bacterium]|nr:hypothetical protein [Clostridia bacterium]
MKNFKLVRVRFSPGYSDMRGACHSACLEKDGTGAWTMEYSDREDHSAPTVVTTYEVPPGAAEDFEKFLNKKRVLSLEKRLKSSLFATDYSPWSYSIDYEKTEFGKAVQRSCSLSEYKLYSKRDLTLLKELRERFEALRGRKISETTEPDE